MRYIFLTKKEIIIFLTVLVILQNIMGILLEVFLNKIIEEA